MKIQFDILFEVEIYHNYYNSGISEDFNIVPTSISQKILRNYGLLFRKTSKGFVVLYEYVLELEQKHPLKPIEENIKFSFILQSKNPYLINYSNLPLDKKPNQIYRLHNLNDNQQNGNLLLTSDDTINHVSQNDRIEIKPQLFQYSFESLNETAEMEILDELRNPVPKSKRNVAIVDGILNYLVNLQSFAPGKYILKVDGDQKLEFYSSDELVGKNNVFGVIDIFRNDSVPNLYQFTKPNNDVKQKTYQVKIDNRMTYWKYYIVLKYRVKDVKPDDFSLTYPDSNGTNVKFESLNKEELADGTVTFPFLSNIELPLKQVPVKGIKLDKTNSNGNRLEIANLPIPSVKTLTKIKNELYSNMYVYI